MKKHEWYLVECEQNFGWEKPKWERRVNPWRTKKEVIKWVKYLRKMKNNIRKIRIFKVAPYEEIDK